MIPRTLCMTLLICALTTVESSSAAVIRVPEDVPTIRGCIDAAGEGDVCSVAPGVYHEGPLQTVNDVQALVVLDKAITLEAREPYMAVLDGQGSPGVFILVRAAATIDGFVIRNVTTGIMQRWSPDVRWYARNLVLQNIAGTAIAVDDKYVRIGSAELRNVTIDGCDVAFAANDANTVFIENSVASNCNTGLLGCDHNGFSAQYFVFSGVRTQRAADCGSEFLPTYGPGVFAGAARLTNVRTTRHVYPAILRCTSDAVDAGNPAPGQSDVQFPPAWGGQRNDAGAYGGPGADPSLDSLERQYVAGQMLLVGRSGTTALIEWCAVPGSTGSDLVRGEIGVLRSSGGNYALATAECLGADLWSGTFSYAGVTAPGTGSWFLARCRSCTPTGSYDSGSPGQLRSRDPGIAASGHACP